MKFVKVKHYYLENEYFIVAIHKIHKIYISSENASIYTGTNENSYVLITLAEFNEKVLPLLDLH